MAIPVTPKMAASALMQSAGMTQQSAARRFWANRFRVGGPRIHKQGMETDLQPPMEGVPDHRQVTGPGGIPGMHHGVPPMRPFAGQVQAPGGSGSDPGLSYSGDAPETP